jgi:hypothetical protein
MGTRMRLLAAGVLIVGATPPVLGQKPSAADLAQRISGTWTINAALTRALSPARGRPGGGVMPVSFQQRGSNPYPPGVRANPTNTEPTPAKPADLTPAELAERRALSQLQQVMPIVTITATADQVTIAEERSEAACAIDGKSDTVRSFGMYMDLKCRWDKDQLRQEFSTARNKLTRLWSVDGNGHLVLKVRREGVTQNSPDVTTVYDRSQAEPAPAGGQV